MNLRTAIRAKPVAPAPAPGLDPELVRRRDALVERMTIMQSELGGLFYEMAIRDHIGMDVLIGRAAELQGVDTELAELERRLGADRPSDSVAPGRRGAGDCPACGAAHVAGAAYCSQCAHPLAGG